jgi:hypothetical protein
MRTEGEISYRLKQVIFRHLKKKLKGLFKRHASRCIHNVAPDEGHSLHVCNFTQNGICDSDVGYCQDQINTCKDYETRDIYLEKEGIKKEFRELLLSDRSVIVQHYPDIAALMWVLDDTPEDFSNSLKEMWGFLDSIPDHEFWGSVSSGDDNE